MIYKSHHICTKDGEVRVGGTYIYEDSQASLRVEVLEDLSDKEWVKLYLRQIPEGKREQPNWQPFLVSGLRGNFEYKSSWKLREA